MQGHIDKLIKNIKFDINKKPIGATQWDFICSIPEAKDSLLSHYKVGPESLFLYLTSDCSMECEECVVKKKETLNIEYIKALFENQKNKRLKYVVLDGDPLLANNFENVIDLLIEYKLSYSINTFTCPTAKILNKIKDTVAKIQFRMPGLNNKKCNDKIIKALEICREYNIYTAIIFSINSNNFNDISKMIEFCKKYNVKQFSFSRLEFCPNMENKHQDLNNEEYLKISKQLVDFREKEKSIHITSNDAIWKGCGACALTATIYPNGDIYPCAFLKKKCGNIENGIESAWDGEIFQNIRNSNLSGKCGKCKYKLLCKGCRALVYEKTGDYLGEDRGCWI